MTSASKVGIAPSGKSTNSVKKGISVSTNGKNADGVARPSLEIDIFMNKGQTLPSVAESSKLMLNAPNNEAQPSLLIKDDSLTGAWIKILDSVAENSHLINDAIISVDPLNVPLQSNLITADFTSPNDKHSTTASADKGTTNITGSSELIINKATVAEGRPSVPIASLHAKIS
ncbi:hypothetical protein P7K49_006433, partial [Saguinus oedipus]